MSSCNNSKESLVDAREQYNLNGGAGNCKESYLLLQIESLNYVLTLWHWDSVN